MDGERMADPITDGGGGRSLRNGLLMLGFGLFSAAVLIVWLAVFSKALAFALSHIAADFPAGDFLGKADAGEVLRAAWYATPLTVAYIAALIGYHKFGLFREGKPHLTIDLSASSRPVSAEHNHIGVIARIHNTSKVAVPVFNVEWELAAVAPYSAADIAQMEEEFSNAKGGVGDTADDEFPWRWLDDPYELQYDMLVEPNEIEQLTFDFVIPQGIDTVVVSLYVENAFAEKSVDKLGWYRRLFYDLNRP